MEWELIETAPKDGSRVLCWREGWNPVFLRWKTNDRMKPPASYWGDPVEWDDYDFVDDQPTHWLPLKLPA